MRQKATYPRPDMRLPHCCRECGRSEKIKRIRAMMCGGSAKRLLWRNVGMRYGSIALFLQFYYIVIYWY